MNLRSTMPLKPFSQSLTLDQLINVRIYIYRNISLARILNEVCLHVCISFKHFWWARYWACGLNWLWESKPVTSLNVVFQVTCGLNDWRPWDGEILCINSSNVLLCSDLHDTSVLLCSNLHNTTVLLCSDLHSTSVLLCSDLHNTRLVCCCVVISIAQLYCSIAISIAQVYCCVVISITQD